MSDPITCPECEGRRGQRLGRMFLTCRFCQGRGWVGGAHEPAERDQNPPPVQPPAWEHKAWADPVVAAALPCRYCLGARSVAHVDEDSGTLLMAAFPGCADVV
ncbi:hypothetical protein ACTMTF_16685 [Nonomuraea sp. ZG12]|uniref:hypothetical protein n=1 Tax=Nonomuraea sp. ZG12 TaxID=3452207 RepID=UPI003F8A8C68